MHLDPEAIKPYLVPAAIAAFLLYRHLKFRRAKARLPELIKEGAVFVDVRTPAEYASGCRPGSLNIPLADIPRRAAELDKARPVVLCCASGARSAAAAGILKGLGFSKVLNAGSWRNTL
jgi:rhodanese-related sulfurtransferase